MKKKFMFTSDSSFTHKQDEMHHEVTEHIIEDDKTHKLYHYVVSYGSWFGISAESVFMAHLLKEIGVTGFCQSYIADDSEIDLPWYPMRMPKRQSIVELPDFAKLEDVELRVSDLETSKRFQQTFLGKSYEIKSYDDEMFEYESEDILNSIFGCATHQLGEICEGDKVFPIYCILASFDWHDKEEMQEMLKETSVCDHEEIRPILERFASIDIKSEIQCFEQETQRKLVGLRKELKARQTILRDFLASKDSEMDEEASEEIEL